MPIDPIYCSIHVVLAQSSHTLNRWRNEPIITCIGEYTVNLRFIRHNILHTGKIFFVVGLVTFTLSGCGASHRITNGWGRDDESGDASRPRTIAANSPSGESRDETPADTASPIGLNRRSSSSKEERALEFLLRNELDNWMGVPHVMGGTTKRGVDCSALVQRIYADVLNVQTPRTTEKQLRSGVAVTPNSWRTGDLVFFQPSRNYRHVGIYLSDGNFAHSSSSQGVMISNLSEPYWNRSYTTARRILQHSIAEYVSSVDR